MVGYPYHYNKACGNTNLPTCEYSSHIRTTLVQPDSNYGEHIDVSNNGEHIFLEYILLLFPGEHIISCSLCCCYFYAYTTSQTPRTPTLAYNIKLTSAHNTCSTRMVTHDAIHMGQLITLLFTFIHTTISKPVSLRYTSSLVFTPPDRISWPETRR
jgi:hypothetical protein